MRLSSITLAVALLLPAAIPAAAQQSAAPETDVPDTGIHFGPLGLSPSIVVRDIGRDNNVFNDSTNPKSDWTATITPKLDVAFRPGPMRLTYTTNTDYVWYQTYASERGTNVGNALRADFAFGPFKPSVGASIGTSRDRLNREIDVRARHRSYGYSGGVEVSLFEGVTAAVGVRESKTTFDPGAEFRGQPLDLTLNSTTDAVDAGGGVALTPLTTLRVTYTRERTRFEFMPDRNSESFRITPTVTFSPLAILNGSASFGYRRFTSHSPAVPDYAGLVAAVTLATTAFSRYRIETGFTRDLSYSYDETTPEYLETGVSAALTWQITNRFDLHLNAGRSRLHYRSPTLTASTDDDTVNTYGFSFGYRVTERLRAGINGDWQGRTSERSIERGYDNRRIYATMTWGI